MIGRIAIGIAAIAAVPFIVQRAHPTEHSDWMIGIGPMQGPLNATAYWEPTIYGQRPKSMTLYYYMPVPPCWDEQVSSTPHMRFARRRCPVTHLKREFTYLCPDGRKVPVPAEGPPNQLNPMWRKYCHVHSYIGNGVKYRVSESADPILAPGSDQ